MIVGIAQGSCLVDIDEVNFDQFIVLGPELVAVHISDRGSLFEDVYFGCFVGISVFPELEAGCDGQPKPVLFSEEASDVVTIE